MESYTVTLGLSYIGQRDGGEEGKGSEKHRMRTARLAADWLPGEKEGLKTRVVGSLSKSRGLAKGGK